MCKVINHKTKRLLIRPLELSDYQSWKDCRLNLLEKRNQFDSGPRTEEDCSISHFRKIIRKHRNLAKNDQLYVYGVFDKKTKKWFGQIDILVLCRQDRQLGNIGYWIANRYWGRGFGKEAAIAALEIGFSKLNLHRLEASIDRGNIKSIRLAKSIGMKLDGLKRKHLFDKYKGQWIDQIVYFSHPEDIGLKSNLPAEKDLWLYST